MNEKRTETMKNLPVSERPYEKAMEQGVEVLSDAELLAVILRTGTKDISARALAGEDIDAGRSSRDFPAFFIIRCRTIRQSGASET